jgi:hypothetical protein
MAADRPVGGVGAACHGGTNTQLLVGRESNERLNVLSRSRAGARESDVRGVDTEAGEAPTALELVFERGIGHGRGLKTITEGLIMQGDRSWIVLMWALCVPVVDDVLVFQGVLPCDPSRAFRALPR